MGIGMFIDLVSTDNQISCNVKAAKLLGLDTAIYLNELINIHAKALSKNKLNKDGFFRLKRSYITDRTTIKQNRQLEIDENLMGVEIISKDKFDPDLMKVDIEMYASILTNQSNVISNKVEKLVLKKSKSEKAEDKKRAIIDGLKSNVRCSNEELRELYFDWIDSIYEKPGGFLSKSAIKIFEDTVNNYTKGDLDLAISLLKLATVKAYKNADWVINLYEKDKNVLRTTVERSDENVELSSISY